MSDSDESGVTYMDVSSPFEELSDIGSLRADDYEHLMLPEMLEDPYVEVALQAPPSPVYVPGSEHADDEIVAEDQPYAEDASPIAQSPEYAPSAEETEPFETDESASTPSPHPAYRTTARISIPAPVPMPAWTDSEVVRLLAISSPPASPLSPWSSPPSQIPFPPLPPILSPPSPILSPAPPPSPIRSLGYRAAMMRLSDEAASTSHSPPLQLPSANSDESGVTYTDISSPFEELSDIGSPRANDHKHLMLLEMLEDPYVDVALQVPPFPDYIPGPEEPEQAPPSPDYVSGPEHTDDEIEESSEDDEDVEDEDMDVKADEEEEEYPAPADSVVVAPTAADQAPSVEETKPFEIDESAATPPPHPAYPSPLSPWSSPPPHIPFPPLPPILSPPSPILSPAPPPSPIRSLGYRAAMIRLRDKAASTTSPPLQLPSASCREDRPEVTLPPRKRLDIALGPRYEVGESSSATASRPVGGLREDYGFVATMDREIMHDPEREFGYGITDSWDEIVETLQGAPVSTDTESGGYTERQLLAGRLNMLFRDRRAHVYTRHLMETEARMSREAWVRATDASDLVHGEVMSLRTTMLGQMSEIRELHAADRRRQTMISELLRIDHRRSTEISELRTALQG
nr:hypothetical protein [Tanacetum cinerariifolium]